MLLALLTLHNLVRWAVLLFGLIALVRTLPGLNGTRVFTAAERRAVSSFMGAVHLQLLLGLLLFAVAGMTGVPVFPDGSRPSFQWEHLGVGVLIAVAATLANSLSKRAGDDAAKFRAAASWTGISLLLALLMIPWWRPLLRLFTQ